MKEHKGQKTTHTATEKPFFILNASLSSLAGPAKFLYLSCWAKNLDPILQKNKSWVTT